MSIEFIAINPTQHREHCFDLEGFNCSRWEVDFYRLNEGYDQDIDDPSDKYQVSSLQFTAFDLEEETPEQAYKFLQKALKALNDTYLSIEGNTYPSHGGVYSVDISFETTFSCNLKQVLIFTKTLLNIDTVFNISNIDDLCKLTYFYYSSVKWLDYPFHAGATDHKIFESMEDFEDLANGKYELKPLLNANLF